MAAFLDQRALAKHGADYERTRAIASVALLIACADRALEGVELALISDTLSDLAASMDVKVMPLDRALLRSIGQSVAMDILQDGEGAVFDAVRPYLDGQSGALAITLAAKVAAADGEVDEDELALLRPMAKQLGFDPAQTEELIAQSRQDAPGATLH